MANFNKMVLLLILMFKANILEYEGQLYIFFKENVWLCLQCDTTRLLCGK